MYAPAVVEAREDALRDAGHLADLPHGRLTRYPHDVCWQMRDRLADVPGPKGVPTRALLEEEQQFIHNERLLTKIDYRYWSERYAVVVKETQDAAPLVPRWASQDLFLARLAQIEEARWRGGHPDGILFNVLKARQLGISTEMSMIGVHRLTTQGSIRGLVAGDVQEQSSYIFGMAEGALAALPWYLKPATAEHQTGTFWKGDTGASLRAAWGKSARGGLAERDKAKGNLGRGKTYGYVHLTEISTWERPEQIDDGLLPGVPRRPRTFLGRESTAKGRYDYWHREWLKAEKGLGRFLNIFIPWYIEPDKYWLPSPAGWDPADSTKAHADAVLRDSPKWCLGQTIRLSREQLYWYEQTRRTFDEEADGPAFTGDGRRLPTFYEEYPACVTGETRISTERGIIPITEAISCRETESGPIIAAGPQPVSPVYQLTTSGGRVLRGTYDHPVQTTNDGFVWLGRLEPGQEIVLRGPRFAEHEHTVRWVTAPLVEHTIRVTPLWGKFLGYFMGDGSWYKDTISIICDAKDTDVHADVQDTLKALFGGCHERDLRHASGSRRKLAVEYRLNSRESREVFTRLGIIHSLNGASYRRRISVPDAIWRSPLPIVREFLSALFECDGSGSGSHVTWGSSKLAFAREVQLLLLGFGIPAAISACPKRNSRGQTWPFYRMSFTREMTTQFANAIMFISRRKQNLLLPSPHRHPRTKAEMGRRALPMRAVDTVLTVVAQPSEVTYDLTVGTSHVFSANGILTHNTPEEAFQHAGVSIFGPHTLSRLKAQERAPIDLLLIEPAKDIALLKQFEREDQKRQQRLEAVEAEKLAARGVGSPR